RESVLTSFYTLSLHDALPILLEPSVFGSSRVAPGNLASSFSPEELRAFCSSLKRSLRCLASCALASGTMPSSRTAATEAASRLRVRNSIMGTTSWCEPDKLAEQHGPASPSL